MHRVSVWLKQYGTGPANLGFWVVFLLSVVIHGRNNPIGVLVTSAATGFILLLSLLLPIPRSTRSLLKVCIAAVFVIIAYVWFQTASFYGDRFGNEVWNNTSLVGGIGSRLIATTPGDEMLSLLKVLSPIAFFGVGLVLFQSDQASERALKFIAIGGGVISLLSVIQFVVTPDIVLVYEKTAYLDSLTGPFVNRNTAATFFGLILLVLVAVNWQYLRFAFVDISEFYHARGASFLVKRNERIWIASMYAGLMLCTALALILTKSRAGIAATAVSIFLLANMEIWLGTSFRSATQKFSLRRAVVGSLVVISILVSGMSLLAGRVVLRAEVLGVTDARFCVNGVVAEAIRDNWPWGTGLSSFAAVFPRYRDPVCGINGVWDKAHNFYLEGLLTLGLFFPAVVVTIVLVLVSAFIRGILLRRRYRLFGFLGLTTLILVGIHSSVDFSIQMPGVAMLFSAILAPITTICLTKKRGRALGPDREA